MEITYRRANAEDLPPAMGIVQDAYNDLRVRHGLPPSIVLGSPLFQSFSLIEPSSSLWVAEAGGVLRGVAFSWMRERFWFLAQLFVRPNTQSRGIGQAMLAKTLDHAEEMAAENRALITMAYNRTSIGLYIRNGLFPREPLLRLVAPTSNLEQSAAAADLELSPIEPWPASSDWLSQIDRDVLGFCRGSHHAFLLGGSAARALRIQRAGRPIGYAYLSATGHIGPLAITPGEDGPEVLRAVVRCAVDLHPEQVSLIVPGKADQILAAAFQLGFRIDETLVLLAAKPFGNWSHYLPSNPSFM